MKNVSNADDRQRGPFQDVQIAVNADTGFVSVASPLEPPGIFLRSRHRECTGNTAAPIFLPSLVAAPWSTREQVKDLIGRSAFASLQLKLCEQGLKAVVLSTHLAPQKEMAETPPQSLKYFCHLFIGGGPRNHRGHVDRSRCPPCFVLGHAGRAWNRVGLVNHLGSLDERAVEDVAGSISRPSSTRVCDRISAVL